MLFFRITTYIYYLYYISSRFGMFVTIVLPCKSNRTPVEQKLSTQGTIGSKSQINTKPMSL